MLLLHNDDLMKMAHVKPVDFMLKMMYSVSDSGIFGEKEFRILPIGYEPNTFRLALRMPYH